jgi:hypothetical protein
VLWGKAEVLGAECSYFVGNQRFISAAMRSRPAPSSASLRRCRGKSRGRNSPYSITGFAANSGLLGRFFSALRFLVAVIFKSLLRFLPASFKVLSKRALASGLLYLVGDGLFMSVQSDSR